MKDLTGKRDRRDKARKKRWPVHGKSLQHIMNAIRNRAEEKKDAPRG